MADIISGTEMRAAILDELRQEVEAIREKHGTVPGLVTILVGENPASISYVTLKVKTALSLGFHEIQDNQPADVSEEALLALIDKYNRDPSIHGILVQLPLPKHIDENKVIYAIDPTRTSTDSTRQSGPYGCRRCRTFPRPVRLRAFRKCCAGRSNRGRSRSRWPFQYRRQAHFRHARPGAGANATVTMVHTRTKTWRNIAAGPTSDRRGWRSRSAKPDWIKPGATVIDVGVNRVGFNEKTGKPILSGDVDFAEASKVAGKITPVPGGVGPMTIAMLMKNTVRSAWHHLGR
ncbi:MAG: tetrahydrofolate dehydrogenase/cyclohydrolase catalytic domain-containing protein [Bilophila wadsworthia]